MTSRKSSSNLGMIFAVIKRNLWLLILAVIGFIFSMPIATAISNQRKSQLIASYQTGDPAALNSYLQNAADNLNNVFYGCSVIIVVVGAVLAAIVLFQYLTKRKQIDLYHSLPVKRGRLFAINYCAGFLIFLIPFAVGCLLNACVIMGLGYGGIFSWSAYLLLILKLILAFFCLYSMMIFAITLSGTVIMSLLLMFAMNAACPIILALRDALHCYFYETYWVSITNSPDLYYQLSPFLNAINNESTLLLNMLLLAVGVLATAFAALCYNKRRSEAAGSSLVFKCSKPIIRIPLTLLGTLCFATAFYMIGSYSLPWLYFGALAGAVLIGQFLQIWIEGEFSAVKKGWISVAVAAIIACGIFTYTSSDLGNYDTYLPAAEEVKSVQLEMGGINYYTTQNINSSSTKYDQKYRDGDYEEWKDIVLSDPETIKAVLSVAQYGIDNLNGYTTYESHQDEPMPITEETAADTVSSDTLAAPAVPTGQTTDFNIVYNLENGKKVYRSYQFLNVKEIQEQLIKIIDDTEYQAKYADVNSYDTKQIFVYSLDNLKSHSVTSRETRALSEQDQRRLVETYAKEFKKLTGEIMSSEVPIGQIGLIFFPEADNMPQTSKEAVKSTDVYESPYAYCINNYPIYPSFTETVALVKELYGENFFDNDLANITSIDVYYTDGTISDSEEVNEAINEKTLYDRYARSPYADTITYEEFVYKYGNTDNTTIYDAATIKNIMDSTKDSAALVYTPFFNTDDKISYSVNYKGDYAFERVKLAK
ncbi:MAG: DUF6449 domain-containing protein [Bacillota bacterium]|jgi:ABC-2 type transport system permease protein